MQITSTECRPLVKSPAISEPNSATPIELPVWRSVFSVPAATPERDR